MANNPANYQRPVAVWIISFFFFIKTALALLSFALILLLLSGVIPINDAQHRHFESQISDTDFVDFLPILIKACNFGGAIFLFLLRRPALYCFGAGFVVPLLNWGYLISVRGWSEAIGNEHHLFMVLCGLCLSGAILIYVWYLSVSKILR